MIPSPTAVQTRRFLLAHWEWVLFGLCVFVAMPLSRGYGMAWDEAQHAIYGSYVWDYFRSGFQDMRWRTDIGGLYTYGTLFDLPSAIFHRTFSNDLFEWRSFFMATAGAFTLPAVAKIGRRLGGAGYSDGFEKTHDASGYFDIKRTEKHFYLT